MPGLVMPGWEAVQRPRVEEKVSGWMNICQRKGPETK
jgi:hypothetical protein